MSEWERLLPRPRSKYLRVKCADCENEQIVFNQATNVVKCNVCSAVLAEPKGGKAEIKGEILAAVE